MKVHLAWLLFFTSQVVAQVCGPANGTIDIAGSSTVLPIASAWGISYSTQCDVVVNSNGGGSSVGAASVCGSTLDGASPVDIGMMSREWEVDEATTDFSGYQYQCVVGDATRKVIQIEVAIDGLSVTMSAGGVGATCVESLGGLTVDQLRWIYSSYTIAQLVESNWDSASLPNSDGSDATRLWSELSADCATEAIQIAGPDPESDTYEFFRETILTDFANGETFGGAVTYFNSNDVESLVQYIESDGTVIGFFGFAYFVAEGDMLYAAPIENFAGEFVAPTLDSVTNETYFPLSRRLFMNLLDDPNSLASTGSFIIFGMSQDGANLVAEAGYVPISEALRELMIRRVQSSQEFETPIPAPSIAQSPSTSDAIPSRVPTGTNIPVVPFVDPPSAVPTSNNASLTPVLDVPSVLSNTSAPTLDVPSSASNRTNTSQPIQSPSNSPNRTPAPVATDSTSSTASTGSGIMHVVVLACVYLAFV